MPGHATATYGHSGQFLAKVHGKTLKRLYTRLYKNTVKNSKNRRLFWSGVAETRWSFSFPSCLHIHAGVLQRAASWREKPWGNTQVGRGASFEEPEYNKDMAAKCCIRSIFVTERLKSPESAMAFARM